MAVLLSAFSITAFAGDDNATGGDGNTHPAAEGYGWYNSYQYLYKVTLFVGKKDTANKQSSLTNDFYRVGTVIIKKTGWNVSSSVVFGNGTKVDYYGGAAMTRMQSPYIISDANCPKIPIACGGDIDIVKQYFGSTGTMNTLLNAITAKEGKTAYGLLKSKSFTINGTTKTGWSEADLMPNGTTNKVPWVIVYEPMILMHLKDKVNMVAFTATEYAIAQQNGWYNWRKGSDGSGQNVAILPERHLPSSIQLEESWFGYPVYPVHNDSYRWEYLDIIKGGGWGMRWLGANVDNGIDLSVQFLEYNPAPVVETRVNHKIKWCNNKNYEQTVLCEIYSGDYLVTSYTLTIPGNSYVIKDTVLIYHATRTHKMIAKINYANRYSETNPNNNAATVTVIPKSSDKPAIDYGVYFGGVETPEPNNYGQVEVTWRNYKQDVGTVLCELYRDNTLVWSGYKTFEGNESIKETYSVYYPGSSERTLTAKINYAHKDEETDPNDNMRQRKVKPEVPKDTTYDFSVSGITVTPGTVYQGESVQVSFYSDNWNRDLEYDNILVELLVGDTVVRSERVHFDTYGRNHHTYTVMLDDAGSHTIAARINWENRFAESNATNNYAYTAAVVRPYYEFSVSNLSVSPVEVNRNNTVTITFRTDSWDQYNEYKNIPVQILYDWKVVYTEYVDYDVYEGKNHSLSLNVGDKTGKHEISARVNWQDHLNEVNINNNETEKKVVTVIDSGDLRIEAIKPNAAYREGLEVVTSFRIYNDSDSDVLPSDNNTVTFRAYYKKNGVEKTISSQTWNQAVIPSGDSNLIWFKWKVPDGLAGTKVYVTATVNSNSTISETSRENNIDSLEETVSSRQYSATPDTRYEREKPASYKQVNAPGNLTGSATWSVWKYENGAFTKVNYGIRVSAINPTLTPDQNNPSAEKKDGVWTMKSGYGFSIAYNSMLSTLGGYTFPSASAYTVVQSAYATLPEYGYSTLTGKYRTLEKVNGTWSFEENADADHNGRIHFTPLWFPDGDYVVSVTASNCWTPAGMITARGSAKAIKISGSAYDDWTLGR